MTVKEKILTHASYYVLFAHIMGGKNGVVLVSAEKLAEYSNKAINERGKYIAFSDTGSCKVFPMIKSAIAKKDYCFVNHSGYNPLETDVYDFLSARFDNLVYHGNEPGHKADYSYTDKNGITQWIEVKGFRGYLNK